MDIKVMSLISLLGLLSCSPFKRDLNNGKGTIAQARENVILDLSKSYKTQRSYLRERKGQPFNVFWIFMLPNSDGLWEFLVYPENNGFITQGVEDSLGTIPDGFPNNYKIENGKLFIWMDSITPLRREVLTALNDFDVLDSTAIKKALGILPIDSVDNSRLFMIDHGLKVVKYYFCPDDLKKYKRVTLQNAFKKYRRVKLKCN